MIFDQNNNDDGKVITYVSGEITGSINGMDLGDLADILELASTCCGCGCCCTSEDLHKQAAAMLAALTISNQKTYRGD